MTVNLKGGLTLADETHAFTRVLSLPHKTPLFHVLDEDYSLSFLCRNFVDNIVCIFPKFVR